MPSLPHKSVRKFTLAFTACLLAVAGSAALAADEQGQFAIKGAGQASCVQFLETVESRSEETGRFLGWFEGYLTAANKASPHVFDYAPLVDIDIYVDSLARICRRREDASIYDAAEELIGALQPYRLTTQSPITPASKTETDLFPNRHYQATLNAAVGNLAKKGFLAPEFAAQELSVIDRSILKNAIMEFQEQDNIQPTGALDNITVMRLLLTNETE